MINLLPPDVKQSYRYGLANVILFRWIMACIVALVGVGVIATYGWLNFHQDINNYNDQVTHASNVLKKENQVSTYAQVQDITNNFTLSVDVLKNEVLFSKLLSNIAKVMPANAYLTGLSLVKNQGAIDMTVQTQDQFTATQVQINLADPANNVFSKADINNITCVQKPQVGQLPCVVTIRALFGTDNQYLFINQKGTS
ncbi:MAG TPA: hypothetical protein VFN56_02035 [Candidatus Saccharimonadales bacterium]|nr:hypothetical protein [Candidatus Saccharimonadales bacterium]